MHTINKAVTIRIVTYTVTSDNCHLYYCCVSSRRGAERRAMQHYLILGIYCVFVTWPFPLLYKFTALLCRQLLPQSLTLWLRSLIRPDINFWATLSHFRGTFCGSVAQLCATVIQVKIATVYVFHSICILKLNKLILH